MKWIGIDTEFNNTQEEFVNPVCAVIRTESGVTSYWYDQMDSFKKDFDFFVKGGYYVLSFMSAAEYRYLLSIGFSRDYLKGVKMVDLYPMWRMVLYGINDYNYGKYVLIDGGKKISVHTRPPVDGEADDGTYYQGVDGEEYRVDNIKTRRYNPSLSHACLRLLDVDIDSVYKDQMRDIILYGDIDLNRVDIMKYCESDTLYLLPLMNKLIKIIRTYDEDYSPKDIMSYGEWMLSVACLENNGVPIDVDKMKNFASNYYRLSIEIPTECNKIYPFFKYDDKKAKFIRDYSSFECFVKSLKVDWPLTPTGKFKSDLKTMKDMSFPEIKTLVSTMSSLREIGYFNPSRVDKILKNIGRDGRWRGSLMPYGTLTSRNTPKPSEGYVFAMSRWIRNLVGGVVIGGDYSAEEIYIQALISGDGSFKDSYLSGDPYTWFATQSGALPTGVVKRGDGFYINDIKESNDLQIKHKSTRMLYKSILLGVGYMMGPDKLSVHLTGAAIDALPKNKKDQIIAGDEELLNQTIIVGRDRERMYPKEQRAQYYLDLYKKTFPMYNKWRSYIFQKYKSDQVLRLRDGWRLIGSNRSQPAVVNFPIQGEGQVILRRAVSLCLDAGLRVCTTLHDAIYIESKEDSKTFDMNMLSKCMLDAAPKGMRVDVHEQVIDWDNLKSNWSDEKGADEFSKFGKYLLKNKNEI